MGSGGARNRSGQQPDPNSARSDRRGLKFGQLPADGYDGAIPEWPLPAVSFDPGDDQAAAAATAQHNAELGIWASIWRTPQAFAWAAQTYRWPIIAEYARLKSVVELNPRNAALVAQLHRYRDQMGLTPAGLRENGWQIVDQDATSKVPASGSEPAAGIASASGRLRG